VAQTASRVGTVIGLAAHLGRGMQRVATDLAVGDAGSLPRTVGDLDAAFLSQLMGATVTSVSVIGGDAGTSSRARLALTGHGVPDSVFVKMPAETAAIRLMGELGRLAHTETRFYRELSPQLTGVPKSYGSTFDSVTGRFVLVLEDLAVDRCEFPDTLHPLTPDQASQVVDLLARLHARFWERVPDWAYSASADTAALLTGPLLKMSARRIGEKTDIPVERGRFIDENYRAVARLIDKPPNTVMHGDAHPGNVYFRNGRAGLLDWQAVRRGHPGRELAYTLVTSMATADRQAHERELLDHYRQVLTDGGGPRLHHDELWDRYRAGALYAYVAALITAGMGGMQAEGIAMEGLRRGVAALDDLDTVALLKSSL
jgi:aminoglycoside phosphotransferase (APT) family kinase protein